MLQTEMTDMAAVVCPLLSCSAGIATVPLHPRCLNVREFLDAVDVAMISSCALMAMIPMAAAPTV
jgi:hypothetical protein